MKSIKPKQVYVFLFANSPKFDLEGTIAYGTSIVLHKDGRNTTVSIGSISAAIKTNLALFFQINILHDLNHI